MVQLGLFIIIDADTPWIPCEVKKLFVPNARDRRKYHAKKKQQHLFRPIRCWRYVRIPCISVCMFVVFCFCFLDVAPDLMLCNIDYIRNIFRHTVQNRINFMVKLVFISQSIVYHSLLFLFHYTQKLSPQNISPYILSTPGFFWGITAEYLKTQDPLGPVFEDFLEVDQRLGVGEKLRNCGARVKDCL